MSSINLLDPNFYASLPIYIYVTGGFGVIILINSCVACCYCCKIQRKRKDLDRRDFELRRKERFFEMKLQRQKEHEKIMDSDIVISKPIHYDDFKIQRNIV